MKKLSIISKRDFYFLLLDINDLFFGKPDEYLSGVVCFLKEILEDYFLKPKYLIEYIEDIRCIDDESLTEFKLNEYYNRDLSLYTTSFESELNSLYSYHPVLNITSEIKEDKFYNLLYILVNTSYSFWYYVYFCIKYKDKITNTNFKTRIIDKFINSNNIREKFKNNLFVLTSSLTNKQKHLIEKAMLCSSNEFNKFKSNDLNNILLRPIKMLKVSK